MADHGVLTSDLVLNGYGWGVCYGGYVLGKGYLGSKDFEGYGSGMEAIMRIMDTVGVEEYGQMKGKYVRIATKGLGSSVKSSETFWMISGLTTNLSLQIKG